MRALSLADLKPGMTLADPVNDMQGMLLLKRGSVLTEKSILMLKSWGVTDALVEGEPEEGDEEGGPDEQEMEAIDQGLEEKFADVTDDPVMAEIKRAAGAMLQKRFLKKRMEP
ncbi:MAG: hypothetical protein GY859_27740 [Desulfobacterales bacterium]|nr:hypothetical protein [Desulfobacterales bacterium]